MKNFNLTRKLLEWIGFCAVLMLSIAVISWWQTRDMLAVSGDVIIKPMQLPTLSGDLEPIAPVAGRNTLIYFFAPWCGICRASIGNLAYVNETKTRVIVIALDYASTADVEAFVRDTELKNTVYLGTEDTRNQFQVSAYPSYYVLDSEFRVIGRDMGYSTGPGLKVRTW